MDMRQVERRGFNVPFGPEHFAARVVAGVASEEDTRLMKKEVEKERRHEATMAQLWQSIHDRRQLEKVECLSKHRVDLLWHAARFGDPKPFVEMQARVPTMARLLVLKDTRMRTPLHIVCRDGHLDCLKACLPVPPKVFLTPEGDEYTTWRKTRAVATHHSRTRSGYTPFHLAVVGGHIRCVEYLLAYFKLAETLEEEFYVDVRGRNVVTLAHQYEWNGIRQLLDATMAPFFEMLLLRKQRVVERQQEAGRRAIEKDWERVSEQEQDRYRKLYLSALHDMQLKRELKREKLRNKARVEEVASLDITQSHRQWEESITRRTALLDSLKKQPPEDALQTGPCATNSKRAAALHSLIDVPLDPELVSLSRGEDWLPGDKAGWDRLLDDQAADIAAARSRKREAEEGRHHRLMYPRIGLEVSERVNFGRLGTVRFGGLRVVGVQPASPAAVAGICTDDIVCSINGHDMSALEDMRTFMSSQGIPAGNTSPSLELCLLRAGEQLKVVVDPLVTRELVHKASSLKVRAVGRLWAEDVAANTSVSARAPHTLQVRRHDGTVVPLQIPGSGGTPLRAAKGASSAAEATRDRPWASPPPRREGPEPLQVMHADHGTPWVPMCV